MNSELKDKLVTLLVKLLELKETQDELIKTVRDLLANELKHE
jgi:hypothetical protein